MRIVLVWLSAFVMLFMISVGWWISQPVVIGVSQGLSGQITNPNGVLIAGAVEFVSYIWGPLFDVFIVLWALLNSQKRDVESDVYGY